MERASLRAGTAVPGIGRRLLSMVYEGLLAFAVAFVAGVVFHGAAVERLAGEDRLVFQDRKSTRLNSSH